MNSETNTTAQFAIYLATHAGLTPAEFTQLLPFISEKNIKKGQIELRQGDVCSEVLFVTSGLLRAYTIDPAGKEHLIQFAPEDWWISDRRSFLYDQPAQFFIDAVEDSQAISLDKRFYELAGQIQHFSDFNTRALNNAIYFLQHRVNLLIGATAEERYLDFVERYPKITLRVPQWMIASYLGITPESLSRVRKELARRNFRP